jgi:23S rRNA pseudouridine2605 synthase
LSTPHKFPHKSKKTPLRQPSEDSQRTKRRIARRGEGQDAEKIASGGSSIADSAPSSATPREPDSEPERLQKVLARAGIASRRQSAELAKAGRVRVNGEVVLEPGFRIERPERAEIEVDGRVHTAPRRGFRRTAILLNKPRGLVCSSDDPHEPTVFECLRGIPARLVCAGRLDKASEGLLILSDDGDLVNRLTHPRYGHRKEYLATVRGAVSDPVLEFLNSPVKMDGYTTRPARVDYLKRLPDDYHGARHLLRFTLAEGRNRQIRNLCEQAGLNVLQLVRVAINGLRLPPDMPPGAWRELGPRDFAALESTRP